MFCFSGWLHRRRRVLGDSRGFQRHCGFRWLHRGRLERSQRRRPRFSGHRSFRLFFGDPNDRVADCDGGRITRAFLFDKSLDPSVDYPVDFRGSSWSLGVSNIEAIVRRRSGERRRLSLPGRTMCRRAEYVGTSSTTRSARRPSSWAPRGHSHRWGGCSARTRGRPVPPCRRGSCHNRC